MADLSYVVAITGASGSIYGKRLIEQLILRDINIHIIISDPGKQVIEHELGFSFKKQEDANTIRSKELIKNEADRENQKRMT